MVHQALNKRDFFRLSFADFPATMRIIEVSQRPITTDAKPIDIIDASGGGLCVVAHDDLPIRRGVIAVFDFKLRDVHFNFRGTLVRKVDDMKKFEYGVRFIDVDERQQGALVAVLGRLQVDRHSRTGG